LGCLQTRRGNQSTTCASKKLKKSYMARPMLGHDRLDPSAPRCKYARMKRLAGTQLSIEWPQQDWKAGISLTQDREILRGPYQFHRVPSNKDSQTFVPKKADGALEIQVKEMHDQVHRATAPAFGAGVPELGASTKELNVVACDMGMPTGGVRIRAGLESEILFDVIGDCAQAVRGIQRPPAGQGRAIHSH
jgi:hypothetical protein